jgi:hypothetical protein
LLPTGDYVDDHGAFLSDRATCRAARAIGAAFCVRTTDWAEILAGHLLRHMLGVLALVLDRSAALVAGGEALHARALNIALAKLVHWMRHRDVLLWTGAVGALR